MFPWLGFWWDSHPGSVSPAVMVTDSYLCTRPNWWRTYNMRGKLSFSPLQMLCYFRYYSILFGFINYILSSSKCSGKLKCPWLSAFGLLLNLKHTCFIKSGVCKLPQVHAILFGFMYTQKSFCFPGSGLYWLQRETRAQGHGGKYIYVTRNQELKPVPRGEVTRCQRFREHCYFYMLESH